MAGAVGFADWAPTVNATFTPAFVSCGGAAAAGCWQAGGPTGGAWAQCSTAMAPAAQQLQQQPWQQVSCTSGAQEAQARLSKLMDSVAHLHTRLAQLRAASLALAGGRSGDNFSPLACEQDAAMAADYDMDGCGNDDDDDACSTCGGGDDDDDVMCGVQAASRGVASSHAQQQQQQQQQHPLLHASKAHCSGWGAAAGGSGANSCSQASAITRADSDITQMLECALAAAVHKQAAQAGGCWADSGADSGTSCGAALDIEAAMLLELEDCLLRGGL